MADTSEPKQPGIPEVTALEGTTSVDANMAFEPERLAYRSAVAVGERIAEQLTPLPPGHVVVITGDELLADLANLAATRVILAQLLAQYEAIEARAPLLTPGAGSPQAESVEAESAAGAAAAILSGVSPIFAGLQAGIGLLSLFRENVQFTGAKTSVDQRALQFSVASSLTTRGIAVRLHETEIPPPDSPGSALRTELLEVEQARARAAETVAPHVTRLIDAQARLESAAAVPDNTAAVQVAAQDLTRIRQQMAPLTDALEHADAQLTALRTQLGQTDGTSGLMALGRLLRAERLQADASHYLQVRVVSSGGHHRVSRNLWRMILTGDGVSALGGVVVRWALLDPQGRFLAGGILDERRTAKFPNTWLAPE